MIAPHGSWKSPITAQLLVADSLDFGDVAVDGEDLYWIESRPAEKGRQVIVRNGTDLIAPPFSARTRANEYGGGAFWVHRDTVWFSHDGDRRLYRQSRGGQPEPLTPPGPFAYADGIADRMRNRVVCVREDHTDPSREPQNTLVAIGTEPVILAEGADFYSSPRISPDGRQLAWLAWNHPNMPWDGTELWVASFDAAGRLTDHRRVAGGVGESIFQPEWSPTGELYFVSDRSGWWNLYTEAGAVVQREAEFGRPQWVFGMSTYAFAKPDQIVCTYTRDGTWHLAVIDLNTRLLRDVATPFTTIQQVRALAGDAVFVAGSPTTDTRLVRCALASGACSVIRRSNPVTIDTGYLSQPEAITFPTANQQTAHAFFYPPTNRDDRAPADELPPLLVKIHGGPTSATSNALDLRIQYWTSRGFAVVDVNYGGSTGYGRPYRERLNGQWGVVDVDDCVHAARYLAQQGRVDRQRLAIRGGSAGGYTTLAALAFRNEFQAGASYYGISDLETLATDTHKFESRYFDRLIAPYPAGRAVYRERSPIHAIERINCPVILFQGLEDKVVPPDQSERVFDALRRRGVPVAYVPYAGEQHGFRRAESIIHALESELAFYAKVFGFTPSDPVPALDLANG